MMTTLLSLAYGAVVLTFQAPTGPPDTTWYELSEGQLSLATRTACGDVGMAPDALLRRHDRLQDSIEFRQVGDRDVPAHVVELSCLRVQMYQLDMPARPGWLIHSGESWRVGAVRALTSVIAGTTAQNDVAHSTRFRAGELLGALILAESVYPSWEDIGPALLSIATLNPRSRLALRSCAKVAMHSGSTASSETCSRRALIAGSDSVWHLLNLARLASAENDTATVGSLLRNTLEAANSTGDWYPIGWHLSWFLEAPELREWLALPDDDRMHWSLVHLLKRDARDGLPAGGRWQEHLRRLNIADSLFRLHLPRRSLRRFRLSAAPESDLDIDKIANYWEPGLVPARPYREFVRTHPEYDDRAHVLMRFGEPERRVLWSARDTVTPKHGEKTRPTSVNTREIWRYKLPGGMLILNFEGENFDGSSEATRLVAGVLGSYTCDVDAHRCGLTHRSATSGLPPDRIEELATADRELVGIATGLDNAGRENELGSLSAVTVRLHDATTGTRLIVPAWAIRVGDLTTIDVGDHSTASFQLVLRRWSAGDGRFRTDTLHRNLRIPAGTNRDHYVTGHASFTEAPRETEVWALELIQNGSVKARTSGLLPEEVRDGLRLSDLVVGASNQNEVLTLPDASQVSLGPLGVFDQSRPVLLYWQSESPWADTTLNMGISLHEAQSADPVLTVSRKQVTSQGFSTHRLDLDLSRIPDGNYRLRMEYRNDQDILVGTVEVPLRLKRQG